MRRGRGRVRGEGGGENGKNEKREKKKKKKTQKKKSIVRIMIIKTIRPFVVYTNVHRKTLLARREGSRRRRRRRGGKRETVHRDEMNEEETERTLGRRRQQDRNKVAQHIYIIHVPVEVAWQNISLEVRKAERRGNTAKQPARIV